MNGQNTLYTETQHALVGQPTRYRGLTLFPITNPDKLAAPADYLLMAQAMGMNRFAIEEVCEDGVVRSLLARNSLDMDVLLLDGEEIVGAKQNRVINLTMLVPAFSEVQIPVSCVERGRWRYQSRHFTSSGRMQLSSSRMLKMRSVSDAMARNQEPRSNQFLIWADIDAKLNQAGVKSPTAAMGDIASEREQDLNSYAQALKPPSECVGAILGVGSKVIGLELFDNASTFAATADKIIRAFAMDAELVGVQHSDCAYDDAVRFLNQVLAAEVHSHDAPGRGHSLRLQGTGIFGAIFVANGRCLHAVAFRQ